MTTKIIKILKKDKVSKWAFYMSGLLFFVIYLVSIENIALATDVTFSFSVVQDWARP